MRAFLIAVAVLAALALLPLAVAGGYLLHVLVVIFIFVILAVGLDLVMGYCGQYSFAQGAFYGIGAYTAAILHRDLGFGFWQTLPSGIVAAGLFGLLLGIPSLRLSGHFLAITTIAFQTIVYLLLTQWTSFTGGQYGLPVPKVGALTLFGWELFRVETVRDFYFLALGCMAAAIGVAWRLAHSRIGRQWQAIQDDELLARAIGVDVTRGKLVAFVASAGLAGAAGVLLAHYLQGVSPDDFAIWTSATVVAMVLAGGRASIVGPILGAVLFTAMPEVLRSAQSYKLVIYGVVMILVVSFLPGGIVGLLRRERRA
ncbi:MAG: branched-chain amino acid ABC transporter permease [Alphaproteobacteria bacterium]|nr:branched-chain amino acid ABC transporter permease [Alphaproteobacteria bacterium]